MEVFVAGDRHSDAHRAAQTWVARCSIKEARVVSASTAAAVVQCLQATGADPKALGVVDLPGSKDFWFLDPKRRLRVVGVQPELHTGVHITVPFLVVARRTRQRCPFPPPTQNDRTAVLIRYAPERNGFAKALGEAGITVVRSDDVPAWGNEKFRLMELSGHASKLRLPSILGPCLGDQGNFRVLGSYPAP